MAEWFAELSGLQQTLFGIAVVSTAVFSIQVIFTLFGRVRRGRHALR